VKIRGFRIELGEIEARLMDHELVRETLVLALGSDDDKRLVAYVVADAKDNLAQALRDHLAPLLPDYMIPSAFVRLDRFPLTPNGKTDRRALPEPERDAFASQTFEEPQGDMEISLAGIWSDLLKVDRISRHDNFFMLGGHSLLAMRLINRILSLGVRLQLSTLFSRPNLSDLAGVLAVQRRLEIKEFDPIMPIQRDGPLLLSFSQQRLWFLAQIEGGSEAYHMPTAIRLRGHFDCEAWRLALSMLFARHEALRSTFSSINGKPRVVLLPPEARLPFISHDLRAAPDSEEELLRLTKTEATIPFDLEKGPLIRSRLIQVSDEDHVLLITQHHIISDGWSIGVMMRELAQLYDAFTSGSADPLSPLSIQYPDFAAWERERLSGDRLQEQAEFWRLTLADAPTLITLPTDHPRPPRQSFAGASVPIHIEAHTTLALKELSQKLGSTLFTTLIAAWGAVLARLSAQDDIVIGTPTANRNHPDVEQLIGFFVNTLAIRFDLSENSTILDVLEHVRQRTVAAQAHQDLPFDQIVEIAQPIRRLDQTPLFQVMFVWQNNESGIFDLPGVQFIPVKQPYNIVKFDLELALEEANGEIVGALHYSTALFDRSTIERQTGYLQVMLKAMVADVTQSVGSVDLLSDEESDLLLHTWNKVPTQIAHSTCMYQLFEAQAVQSPDAIAAVHKG
ncbi:hypothetical protein BGZ83_003473, partial [Gryganskiella cystojenkinii]